MYEKPYVKLGALETVLHQKGVLLTGAAHEKLSCAEHPGFVHCGAVPENAGIVKSPSWFLSLLSAQPASRGRSIASGVLENPGGARPFSTLLGSL